jgi:hypothetical protein
MGKIYRQEKSFRPKTKGLHTHRDLPDYSSVPTEDETVPLEEDPTYTHGKALRPIKQSDKQAKD